MPHPNTMAAVLSGLLASLLVWLFHRYTSIELTTTAAAVISTGATSIVLFIGREGIRKALLTLWNGPKMAWRGSDDATNRG